MIYRIHEFDKCHFCSNYDPNRKDKCGYQYMCDKQIGFYLDVSKLIEKAKFYDISVADVLSIMNEVNK